MFDLTITFSGLCLLVREPTKLHVLMPPDQGHVHLPTLIFVDQAGTVQKVNITGMDLELPGAVGSNGFASDVPSEVYDFGMGLLGHRTVLRTLLDLPLPVQNVRTRLRLSAGKHGSWRRGGWWNFNIGGNVTTLRLPTAVDWLMHDVNLTHLTIKDMVSGRTFDVFPRDGAIHMLVVHVTPRELAAMGPQIPAHSTCPPNNHPGTHFGLYGPLLNPTGIATLPTFDRPKSHASGLCATPDAAHGHGSHADQHAADTSGDTAAANVAAVAAGAAAAAVAAAFSAAAPGVAAASAATAASAALEASTALRESAASVRAAAAGSELTCMIATAPAAG